MYDILNKFISFQFNFNVIVGDFNFPNIQWPDSASSSQSDTFLCYLQDNFLRQHVLRPTRHASKAILDLVISSHGTNISNVTVNEEFGSSDHSIIEFSVPIKPTRLKKRIKIRNFLNTDWSLFRSLLASSLDWSQTSVSDDVNDVWMRFCSVIDAVLDRVAPFKVTTVRNFTSNQGRRQGRARQGRGPANFLREF